MADLMYTHGKRRILQGAIRLGDTGTRVRIMLVTSAYNPDPDHEFVSGGGLTSPHLFEVEGTGYVKGFAGSGRQTLISRSFDANLTLNSAHFHAANVTWDGLNVGDVGGFIIYVAGTADSNSPLVSFSNSGGFAFDTDGGELQIRWNANGVITM